MKPFVHFLFLVILSTGLLAQEKCEYKFNIATETDDFKLTTEQLAEFMIGKDQNVFMYFSLMKEGDVKSLVLQVSLNSREMPRVMCFNDKSRLSFKLENGTYVSLPYLGVEICGEQTPYEDKLNNSTSEAAFYLSSENIDRLRASELESMRITTMQTNFDIAFQSVISNNVIKIPIYPKEYFIKYLPCIE